MTLHNETLNMLQAFAEINPSAFFRKGEIQRTWNESKTVVAKYRIPEEFPTDFAIYDLRKFLGAINVVENPEFDFKDEYVVIKNSRQQLKYVYADASMINIPKDKDLNVSNPVAEFSITKTDFKTLLKALSALKQDDIAFVAKDGKLTVSVIDKDNKNGDTFSIELGETDHEFNLIFQSKNLLIAPNDYNVALYEAKLAEFKNDNETYWVAAHANSTI